MLSFVFEFKSFENLVLWYCNALPRKTNRGFNVYSMLFISMKNRSLLKYAGKGKKKRI